jgi:hypothetical protein
MVRTALVVAAMVAAPAWAVGEKVVFPVSSQPFSEQLKETLCVSMDCVGDHATGYDVAVTSTLVKDKKKGEQVEVRVLTPGGAVKATVLAPVHDGRLSSTDLVSAVSAVVAAIEAPQRQAKGAPAQKSRKPARLAAKARATHGRG